MDFPQRIYALGEESNAKFGDIWLMVHPELRSMDATYENNPYAIGSKRGFVPVLGDIVWELPKETSAHVPFSAYICQVSDGRQIGYVRVPHYEHNKRVVGEFGELIVRFENMTEAMVFDQTNNPGGSMFHMYAILSHLTDRPLALPRHQINIHEDDLAIAREKVAISKAGEAGPFNERLSPEEVAYYRFLLSEFHAGRRELTNPVHLYGVAEVLPAKNHYTKKIVVLINELTFSAPEFLAAILQDNKRATLFGHRTPGAGGCVRRRSTPTGKLLGVDDISYTWTFAFRTNGEPIESIGVHPDVSYAVTAEDLRGDYAGYRRALLATISNHSDDCLR